MGLAVNNPTNILEIVVTTFWMFMGLSMFGYGIGNIASYLNNAVQDDLDYINSITFFEKLCQSNSIDHKILKKIYTEVEN